VAPGVIPRVTPQSNTHTWSCATPIRYSIRIRGHKVSDVTLFAYIVGMTTRLRRALTESGETAKALQAATGLKSYTTVHHYLSGRRDLPATFIAKAAAFLGVSVEDLVEGDEALLVVLAPANIIERKAAMPLLGTLPDMTPHEAQAFRSTLARWVKARPCKFSERLERMEVLAGYLVPPFGALDARTLTDYRVNVLAAVALAMPLRPK